MLTPMEKLTPLTPLSPDTEPKVKDAPPQGKSVFGAVFRSAIDNVKETDSEAKEAQYLLATGQLDNPAMAMLAGSKNAIAVEFLVQLREKALNAYNELTRMNL